MKVILTCRECGHRELGKTDSPLMNRIKMLNHFEREHPERDIGPTQVRLMMRVDQQAEEAKREEEEYRLQASY